MTDHELRIWCDEYEINVLDDTYSVFNTIRCILLKSIISKLKENNKLITIRTVYMFMNNSTMPEVEKAIADILQAYLTMCNISYTTYDFFLRSAYESLFAIVYNSKWFETEKLLET